VELERMRRKTDSDASAMALLQNKIADARAGLSASALEVDA
jgi:hypothetical protein